MAEPEHLLRLVAVGADYNLLLISRIRDESPFGIRSGVIRTVTQTGGVITAAGLIFAGIAGEIGVGEAVGRLDVIFSDALRGSTSR